MNTILLLLMFAAEPRKIYVFHNQNLHSKMLVGDLTRDWVKVADNEYTKKLDLIQKEISPRLVILDVTKPANLQCSYLIKYPQIRYGENGVIEELDQRAFMMSSLPLLSLDVYVNKIEFDYSGYLEARAKAEQDELNFKLIPYMMVNHPKKYTAYLEELQANFWVGEEIFGYPTYSQMLLRFSALDGFPEPQPKYPPKPRIWYVWEKEEPTLIKNNNE